MLTFRQLECDEAKIASIVGNKTVDGKATLTQIEQKANLAFAERDYDG
jgi:hypothetical protein